MYAVLAGTNLEVDDEGYLMRVQDWSPQIAQDLAQQQGLILNMNIGQ